MRKRFTILLATTALAAAPLAITPAADAASAREFKNCDAMHRVYKNGVAKSVKAAKKQVRTDHYKPAVRPAVYRANLKSDADRDGTACEVSR